MKELEEQIQKAFGAMVSSGKLATIIEENVQKSVESIIRSAFDYHGTVPRALAEYLNKNLKVDFEGIGLAGYNEFIAKIIRQKLDAVVFKYGEGLIGKQIDELLSNPPESITLSQLIEQYHKFAREEQDEEPFAMSCEVIESDSVSGYCRVKLGAKSSRTRSEKHYELALTGKGEVYSISAPYSGDITKRLFVGPLFGFERLLFQMYAAKTRLVIDAAWRELVND